MQVTLRPDIIIESETLDRILNEYKNAPIPKLVKIVRETACRRFTA